MIEYSSDQRFFITGKTGSGKSFFARHLTRGLPRLIVLDPNFKLDDWGLEEWNRDTKKALLEGDDVRIRVTWTERGSSSDFWDEVMWEVFEAGDCVLYIDEVYSLAPQGKWMPVVMQKIYTQGRTLGLGAISASQRPRWIPPFCISEAEHFIAFRLNKKLDREYMSEFMGDEVRDPIPPEDPHGFWYYNIHQLDSEYVKKLDIGRGDGWGKFDLEIEDD